MTTLMPVSCWKVGISKDMHSCGLYLLRNRVLHGCLMTWESSLAATRSSYSALTSSVPRIFRSMDMACSLWPRSISELGVSGRKREPTVMMMAGTAARPRLRRQPHPPSILLVA
ncbi:hypothetical protein MUK42_26356 [Musa troglodytarum]|uniref:Uncharacterized protein n=1 Tax=Musa troglodytarum TaxID=320322 RepID=A0A9E7HGW0_9LILI|nr:hypothetical protein MUK42_26356 [Musa troglodytarum]